jgi:pimeloyl-ACP methyl ester carboxylesterase
MKKVLKWTGIILLGILLLLSIVPYLIPLSRSGDVTRLRPYDSSMYFIEDGVAVHYRVSLPETESIRGKILLVHGMGGSTYSFEETVPALIAEGYLVVAVDLPGFGYSSRPEIFDQSQKNRSALLWGLLDEVDRTSTEGSGAQRWLLAGHSMGGGTVAAMAVERQDRTEHLVLIDGALLENDRGGFLFDLPPVMRWIQVALEYFVIRGVNFQSFLRSAYGAEPTAQQVAGYLDPLKLPGTARGAASLLRTSENIPLQELSSLKIPVTAIWGENDSWVPLSDTEKIKDLIPQLVVVIIEDAGHVPMESHPEEFNGALLDIFER